MLGKMRNNFLTGIAIILPLAITVVIIRYLFIKINSSILNPVVGLLSQGPKLSHYSTLIAKTLAFLIVIFLISFIGWAANIIFLRKLFSFGERLFVKVPMVGKIYSVTKEIGSAFLGRRDKAFFKKVVLIEYPRKGLFSIAFITSERENLAKDAVRKDLICVFVPTTPNPTSGIFLLVPKSEIKFLSMSVEEGLKIIVSSGTIAPSE
jgi:uncharacterized membrane protein